MGIFLSVCLSLYSADSFWALICCCFVNYCFIVLILLTCLSDQADCFPAFVVPFPGFVDSECLWLDGERFVHRLIIINQWSDRNASGGLTGSKLSPSLPPAHNDAVWKTLNILWVSRGLLGAFRVESWERRTERYDYLMSWEQRRLYPAAVTPEVGEKNCENPWHLCDFVNWGL